MLRCFRSSISLPALFRPPTRASSALPDSGRTLASPTPRTRRVNRKTRIDWSKRRTVWVDARAFVQEMRRQVRRAEGENDRLKGLLKRKTDKIGMWETNFNIRGGLERIAYCLPGGSGGGVQGTINKLLKNKDFQEFLEGEVNAGGLVLKDVKTCIQHIYHEVSKHAHGTNGTILIRHEDHTVNEVAALLVLFKWQQKNTKKGERALVWDEEKLRGEDK